MCCFLFLGIFATVVSAQNKPVQYFFTTADFRAEFHDALIKWSINSNLAASLDQPQGQYDFKSAFWPMELIGYKSAFVKQRLTYAFQQVNKCSISFQRGLLEVVYTNWPDSFTAQVSRLLLDTENPKIFAMSAEYLLQYNKEQYREMVIGELKRKFQGKRAGPILRMLSDRLSPKAPANRPPMADLLSLQFAPGLTVLYSFQRPDRKYAGRVIVRKPDGTFVRDSLGRLFSVPQLALSVSNLPFYLTNGNTPQGIYRMSGFDVSNSRFIGPTTNIQLSMPFEIPVDSFIISRPPGMDTTWELQKYKILLPESWRTYPAIYHSFFAGEAGRTAIIAHGTTIDPDYYKGTTYFPQTPSLGCLCTFESWSADGYRQRSDQQQLVNAVKKAGNGVGYAVVIDLADKKAPVSIAEVNRLVDEYLTNAVQ